MSKIKSNFLFGAIILFISNLITKVIGAIYKVPLLKILGSEGLGQYQMILPILALFLVISSSGIVVAMSKLVSKELECKNMKNAKKILSAGITISVFCSIILSVILIVFAPNIAVFQKNTGILISYFAIVPAIIVGSLTSVFRGYFLGLKKMTYSGLVQVVEAVCKLIFSLVLALYFSQKSANMAVFGALLGVSVSEILSFVFVIILYFLSKNKQKTQKNYQIIQKKQKFFIKNKYLFDKYQNKTNIVFHTKTRYLSFFKALKKVFSFSFFVMLQLCIMPLVGAIDSVIIVPLLLKGGIIQNVAYSLYGLENGIVSSILALPTVVASAVGASIIPNIKKQKKQTSYSQPNMVNTQTSKNIKNAFQIVWLSSIFCAFVFVLFAKNITTFLYGTGLASDVINELSISSDLLMINAFNIVYLCMLNISTSILQGLEKNKAPVINLASAGILRLFFLILFISNKKLNIYGTALADMAFYSFALILNLREIKKISAIQFNFSKFTLLPVLSCFVMSLSMQIIKILLQDLLTPRILTILVLFVGCGIYLLMLTLTRVVDVKELSFSLLKKKQNT